MISIWREKNTIFSYDLSASLELLLPIHLTVIFCQYKETLKIFFSLDLSHIIFFPL